MKSFLRLIGEQLPHLDLVLRELVTADQVEAIASGDLDLGFVRPPVTRTGLLSRIVQTERLLLAVPAADPFARRGQPAGIAELDGRSLVMYSPVESRYFHELLLGLTVRAHASPRYVQYVSQVHTMLAFVELADGQSPTASRRRSSWPPRGARGPTIPRLAGRLACLPLRVPRVCARRRSRGRSRRSPR